MASTLEEREAYRSKVTEKLSELAYRINLRGVEWDSLEWQRLKGRLEVGKVEMFMCDHDESFQKVTGEWMKEPEGNQ